MFQKPTSNIFIFFSHQPDHEIFTTHNLKSQFEFRQFVVEQLLDPVMQVRVEWTDYCGDLSDHLQIVANWVQFMSKNYEQLDEKFIKLASEVLNRKIVVYHVVDDQKYIYNETVVDNPLYILYFEECRFNGQGHYQSIVPLTDLHFYQVISQK